LGRVVGWVLKIIGTILLIIIMSGMMTTIIGVIYVNNNLKTDQYVDLYNVPLNQTSTVYYYDGDGNRQKLETLYARENREMAAYEEIPPHMINALIAVEDKRFYSHEGVDWWRTVGAFTNMFTNSQGTYGGSTITQQLIKNLTGNKEVTIERKVAEIFGALECEKHYDKKEILLLYLNTCYFGQGCYGVKTAARTYFNKNLSDLSIAESASIIGITNAPTRNDPFNNPKENKKRQEMIIHEMFDQELIDEEQYEQAIAETLVFVPGNRPSDRGTQSFYVEQVYMDVAADLAVELNASLDYAKQLVLNGGLQIDALVDLEIQSIIDDVFEHRENIPTVKGLDEPQAALILMDPYSGAVLGMAGGVGAKEGNLLHNRAIKSVRQPGSAFKPIAAYAPAMEEGLITPYSIIDDSPFRLVKDAAWPRNAGRNYRGLTSVMEGVTRSTNAVAARVVDMLTPEASYRFLTDELGVTSLKTEDIDYAPMSLGALTRGISVLEITAAYCMFPNRGEYIKPRTYSVVRYANGEILLDNTPQRRIVLQEKNAWYMNTMLQNVVNSGTGTRAKLDSGVPAAGKTGTTTEDKDRWFVGYTPHFCAGVWFGFDNPKKISLDESTNPALALWKMVMDRVHEDDAIMGRVHRIHSSDEFFEVDEEDTVRASYCLDSGMKPTDACRNDARGSRTATGIFFVGDEPDEACTMHVYIEQCRETGRLATPYCPSSGVRRVAMLNFPRDMPVAGVAVADEGYRIRYYSEKGGGGSPEVASGFFAPANPGDGASNGFCTTHYKGWVPEPSPPPPPNPPPTNSPVVTATPNNDDDTAGTE